MFTKANYYENFFMSSMAESRRWGIRELCYSKIMQYMTLSYFRQSVQIRLAKISEQIMYRVLPVLLILYLIISHISVFSVSFCVKGQRFSSMCCAF